MLAQSESYIPDYETSKNQYFEKYERKINAILSNIKGSSTITDKDKKRLITQLSVKLKESAA